MAKRILLCALASFVVLLEPIFGLVCEKRNSKLESTCDVPSGLGMCSGTTYSACLTEDTWAEQEARAVARYERVMYKYGYILNRSKTCKDTVKKLQCALEFPACESFGTQAQFLCQAECETVRTACSSIVANESGIIEELYSLDLQALALICGPDTSVKDNILNEEEDEPCFDLDYTGPSYFLWAIGLGLTVLFSFLNAVALSIQKLSLNWHEPDVPVLKQPLWLLGFFFLLLGSAMDFIALGLAPASLLAPLAALSLVWNMIAAPCFLKEKLTKSQIAATLIIFAGAVVTVVFASHTSPVYTLQDLTLLFLRRPMQIYTVVVPVFIMLHMVAIEVIERLPEVRKEHSFIQSIHMIGYAGAAGTTGGQSILFAKATVELFKSAIKGVPGVGRTGETYLIISAMIFCLLIQITYLNGGLLHHNALIVVPVYQAYWIVSGVIGGLVYFDEIRSFSMLQLGMFCLGVFISISGVAFLAYLANQHHHHNVRPRRHSSVEGGVGYESDEEEDMDDLGVFYADENAFNAFIDSTPRAGVAEVLLDMGLAPAKVRRLVGNTNPRLRSQRRKELILTDMGVRPDIAAQLLRSASDRHVLTTLSQRQDSGLRPEQTDRRPFPPNQDGATPHPEITQQP